MADRDPQSQQQKESDVPASAPRDYYSVLMKMIGEASKDHHLLRNLVYALARHNVKPEAESSRAPEEPRQAGTISERALELELERAIERVEADIAQQPNRSEQNSTEIRNTSETTNASPVDEPPPYEQPLTSNAVITLSDEPRTWPEQRERTYLTRVPSWLEPGVGVSLDTVDYAPVKRRRHKIDSFLQLVAASVLGLLLYVGISTWVSRQFATGSAGAPPLQATAAGTKNPSGEAQIQPQQPPPEPQPILPFPLPRSYGIYAASGGQLVALEQLPIKVPIARVMVSAEITQPSKATVAGNKLAFVIFRRDLVASAPQSVSIRVVARVTRAMKFIDGKPVVTPVGGSWRIRDKSYELQVSPLESNREMVVIQPAPDFVFPAGRYALVLNGYGYDFTVAGPVTAPEQCLEQIQVTDGIVVSECPKKSS